MQESTFARHMRINNRNEQLCFSNFLHTRPGRGEKRIAPGEARHYRAQPGVSVEKGNPAPAGAERTNAIMEGRSALPGLDPGPTPIRGLRAEKPRSPPAIVLRRLPARSPGSRFAAHIDTHPPRKGSTYESSRFIGGSKCAFCAMALTLSC
jgi:hypothetical protein